MSNISCIRPSDHASSILSSSEASRHGGATEPTGEDDTCMITEAGATQVTPSDEATCSISGSGAASTGVGATLALRRFLATAGAGAMISIPSIACGTCTSTVCSTVRSASVMAVCTCGLGGARGEASVGVGSRGVPPRSNRGRVHQAS